MDSATQLIVALTGLLVALNTVLSLVLGRKVHNVKTMVNGRMDEAIEAHRKDAYTQGYAQGCAVSQSQETPNAREPPA